MENPEFAAQLLPRARELGAGLALDDFGSGYTSLGHLERYHFDTLKIDPALARPNAAAARPVILRSVDRDGARSRHGRRRRRRGDRIGRRRTLATRLRIRAGLRLRPADDSAAEARKLMGAQAG